MTESQIHIGKIYAIKVSGKIQPVRIKELRSNKYKFNGKIYRTRFVGTNLNSGRDISFVSAAKCRYELVCIGANEAGQMIYRKVVDNGASSNPTT